MKSGNDLAWSISEARRSAPAPVLNPASSRRARISVLFMKTAAWLGGAAFAVLLCNKALMWLSGLLLAAFMSTMAHGQQASVPPAHASSELDSQITALAETYRTAVLKGDLATLMTLYRDDAMEMPFFRPAVSGRNAIQQFYQEQFQSPAHVTSFTFIPTERSVHGDVAYDVGSYTRTMSTPGGTTETSGNYIVLVKHSAGQWKIAYMSYTCNCSPSSGAPR